MSLSVFVLRPLTPPSKLLQCFHPSLSLLITPYVCCPGIASGRAPEIRLNRRRRGTGRPRSLSGPRPQGVGRTLPWLRRTGARQKKDGPFGGQARRVSPLCLPRLRGVGERSGDSQPAARRAKRTRRRRSRGGGWNDYPRWDEIREESAPSPPPCQLAEHPESQVPWERASALVSEVSRVNHRWPCLRDQSKNGVVLEPACWPLSHSPVALASFGSRSCHSSLPRNHRVKVKHVH